MILFALLLATDLTALLDRATAAHEKAKPLYEEATTFSTKMTVEELDKHGAATSTTEIETKADELVRYVEDGVDKTAEQKAKRAEYKKKQKEDGKDQSFSLGFGDPFSRESRDRYAYTLVKEENGLATIAFKPKGKKAPELGVGEATVEIETGAVRKLRFKPSSMPRFVSKLSIEVDCDEPTTLGYAMTRLKAEGEGGILFVKKRFRMTSTFFDWKPSQ